MKCKDCKNSKTEEENGFQYCFCTVNKDIQNKEKERYCGYFESATGADKIRAMTNEMLEIFLEDVFTSGYLLWKYNIKCPIPEFRGWLNEATKSL